MNDAIDRWISRLERAGARAISDLPDPERLLSQADRNQFVAGFSDEMGVCRLIDRFVAARLYGCEAEDTRDSDSPDLVWWRYVMCGGAVPSVQPSGSMTRRRDDQAIEIWTETELAVLHAVWCVAIDRRDAQLIERCLDACVWHVAELEPDNGTGHAWAVHGFVLCAQMRGLIEAEMHAQALLHRCMMGTGVADRVSGMLLVDAARSLRLWATQP